MRSAWKGWNCTPVHQYTSAAGQGLRGQCFSSAVLHRLLMGKHLSAMLITIGRKLLNNLDAVKWVVVLVAGWLYGWPSGSMDNQVLVCCMCGRVVIWVTRRLKFEIRWKFGGHIFGHIF